MSSLRHQDDFYDNGRNTANPHVSTGQRAPLFRGRVANKQAILAFLNSLTAKTYDKTVPATAPSGLAVGGNIRCAVHPLKVANPK